MERRKCRRCGYPMTRLLTNDAGRWSACYTCLSCGCETATGRSAAPTKPRPAEADRALAAYGLYCQLCETLTGKPIAKLDELLTAAQKAKRKLEAYKGAGLRYEEEIARLKRMAAEKWEE